MRWLTLTLTTILCLAASAQQSAIRATGFDSNLRGVSVSEIGAGKHALWISGSHGLVARSLDEGKSWQQLKVEGAADLDFRDVEAFGASVAYVMSSGDGEQSRIYKTEEGGKSWTLQFRDMRPGFFLDSLACTSTAQCLALSDPVEGKFLVLATKDGQHWRELPRAKMPAALPGEGAFAASGTAIAICGNDIYFGTGGPAARVFHSPNRGRSWTATETPMAHGNASSGIFSLACHGRSLVAVGGDYKEPANASHVAIYSNDSGATWLLAAQQPDGYRSAIAFISRYDFEAVGTNGSDISNDAGVHWRHLDALNLNAIAVRPSSSCAVGPKGTVSLVNLRSQSH
jgi:photosystem II stability/assembly factor-like uncharacterized protein